MLTMIDKIFKEKSIAEFGDIFSDEEIEEARVIAFQTISAYIEETHEKPYAGATEECFLLYLKYLKEDKGI